MAAGIQRFVGLYLVVGVLAILFGPLARAIRHELDRHKYSSQPLWDSSHDPPAPQWKLIAFAIILHVAALALWPVFLASTWRTEYSRRGGGLTLYGLLGWFPDTRLYFTQMGGAGTITCRRCGHSEEIVSFLHGPPGGWCKTGLQCQTCGRFATLEKLSDGTCRTDYCECAEELARDRPIFCSRCHSTDLSYCLNYIT
jgi:hypothetical protein